MSTRSRQLDGRFAAEGEAVTEGQALADKQAQIAARTRGTTKGTVVNPQELHPLFADYVADIRLRGRNEKTVARAFYALRRLQGWLNEAGIDPKDVDERVLKTYVAFLRNTVANSSARTETEKVKSAYRYAVRIGILDKNPAEYVEVPSQDDHEPAAYTNAELRQIRDSIMNDTEDAIFHGLVYTGLRRFELGGLTWNDVDFVNSTLRVMGKGNKLRKVPLHPRFAEVLVERREKYGSASDSPVLGDSDSTRAINNRLSKLLARAGVDGGSRPAHKFRATVQCSLYEEQVREDVIDKIMGWAPRNVRQRYYSRIRDESAHEAILRLYRSDPIESRRLTVVPEESAEKEAVAG